MIFKQLRIAIRVFIRQIGTKGMGVLPASDNGVCGIDDLSWCVEMIGVDIVNLDWAGRGGFADHG